MLSTLLRTGSYPGKNKSYSKPWWKYVYHNIFVILSHGGSVISNFFANRSYEKNGGKFVKTNYAALPTPHTIKSFTLLFKFKSCSRFVLGLCYYWSK